MYPHDYAPFAWALVLVVLAVLVLLTVRALANHNQSGPTFTPQRPAVPPEIEVLRIRYAKGEIDQAQYREMLATLLHDARTDS
jgi:uncharacterized membrane protein